tara:strand:- start:106 stop:537 length:432 start_codon:yes stop_codon:yes gene_type:complete
MDTFNSHTLTQVREGIEEALEGVCVDLGINLKLGSITYASDGLTFTTKLEGAVVDGAGNIHDKYRTSFTKEAHIYDLDPAWLDKSFVTRGREYTIVGLNTRAKKFPVHVTAHGKSYKVGADTVSRHMRVTPQATLGKVYEASS